MSEAGMVAYNGFRGTGLRGRLMLAFVGVSAIIFITGVSGWYFVEQIRSDVTVFADVTTPIQTEASRVVHGVRKMQVDILDAISGHDAGHRHGAEESIDTVDHQVTESLDRIARLAERGDLNLDVTAAAQLEEEFVTQGRSLMAAVDLQAAKATETNALEAEFEARRGQISSLLTRIAKDAESDMGGQEDSSRTLIQGGDATFDQLAGILDGVFNETYLKLQGAYSLISYTTELQEIVARSRTVSDPSELAALEKRFGQLLRASANRLRRMAARMRGSDSEATIAELDNLYNEMSALTLGENQLFARLKESLEVTRSAEAALESLEETTGKLLSELDAVANSAAARNEQAKQRSAEVVIQSEISLAFVVFASVLVAMVFGYFFARSISVPLLRMCEAMGQLAQGDVDGEIPAIGRRDEIGRMADAVQVFRDSMRRNFDLTREKEAAQAARARRTEIIDQLMRDFDKQISDGLSSVANYAGELERTAQQMSANAEQTSRQAGNVASASDQAAVNVQMVATTAEELSASIAEIGRQVTQSAQIASNAVHEAETTNATVKGLAEAANKIGEVVSLINDIAGQTNLLALNATIEAARAGEAGKGFAVVAQEVKNLANQTAKATEDIARQIGAVQEETSDAVEAIQKISGIIGEINDIATTIASAIEEQGVSTQEIARNVQQAARGTQDVNTNIESVNRAAGETGSAASQVLNASQEMARRSAGLRGEVDRFLQDIRAA